MEWGLFLDISKAFDKVLHVGLLFKLNYYVVEGETLSLPAGYPKKHKLFTFSSS